MKTFTNSGNVYFAAGSYSVVSSAITNLASGVMTFNGSVIFATNQLGDTIKNQGTMVFDSATGVTDLATAYPSYVGSVYFGIIGAVSLINTGKIEVKSGTLIYPSVSLGDNNSLANQTFQIDAWATLNTETPVAITTNAGTVILGGLANFPDVSGLTTNTGTFAVESGNTFTTAGDFTNTELCPWVVS